MDKRVPPPIPPEDELHDADGCFWGSLIAGLFWLAILAIALNAIFNRGVTQ